MDYNFRYIVFIHLLFVRHHRIPIYSITVIQSTQIKYIILIQLTRDILQILRDPGKISVSRKICISIA
jgi:hypothetical protein